jgi:hypothetical protein
MKVDEILLGLGIVSAAAGAVSGLFPLIGVGALLFLVGLGIRALRRPRIPAVKPEEDVPPRDTMT